MTKSISRTRGALVVAGMLATIVRCTVLDGLRKIAGKR